MTSDEARDLFSEVYDGVLEAERQVAFEACLEGDEELATEWGEFRDMLNEAHALDDLGDMPEVDLLGGVQKKLRERSRGRYYGDRFSARLGGKGSLTPLILGIVMLLVIAVALFGLHLVEVDDVPAGEGSQVEGPAE